MAPAIELALAESALTGFLSWLESAPPSGRCRLTADPATQARIWRCARLTLISRDHDGWVRRRGPT